MGHSITSLIEKLEGAEVGDRMLDAQIWCAVNGLIWKKPIVVPGLPGLIYSFRTNRGDIGLHGDDQRGPVKQYTTSLDAALALAERLVGEEAALSLLQDTIDGWNAAAGLSVKNLPRLFCAAILRPTGEDSPANEGEGA